MIKLLYNVFLHVRVLHTRQWDFHPSFLLERMDTCMQDSPEEEPVLKFTVEVLPVGTSYFPLLTQRVELAVSYTRAGSGTLLVIVFK